MNFRFSEFEMYGECLEIWKKRHDSVWQVLDLLMREFYCEQILRAQNSVCNKKGKEVEIWRGADGFQIHSGFYIFPTAFLI